MLEAISRTFGAASPYLPHGYCFTWSPGLLWSMVVSDSTIAAAYFSIPAALLVFVRKRGDLEGLRGVMLLFSAFIFACGTTHLLSIWTIWYPNYWFETAIKMVTAAVSIITAVLLWPLIPRALRIPSVNQLQAVIARLETEASERRKAEARLARMNAELEARIEERTAALEREIAERQRLQDADRAREAAESASRAKSEFLSRMSHELRTPLNAVLGFAQLSARSVADGDLVRTRSYLQHIEDGGWHLVNMINDILDISRIEQGRQDFAFAAFDLAALVDEAATMVRPAAAEQQVSLKLELPAGLPPVRADRTRLIQVMTNLLSNGVKFNRAGGEVIVLARQCGERLCMDVKDDGLGMSAQQLSQLYQPFNRLGRERMGIPGTGIGLVLVRHLVEHMGGQIEVTSREGAGTTVSISLPAFAEGQRGEQAAGGDGDAAQAIAEAAAAAAPPPQARH